MSDAVVSGSADERQKSNKKKKEQADQKRKYDSRTKKFNNCYFGKFFIPG